MYLKKFRRRAGLSQSELQQRSGVHFTTISKLESDPRRRATYENTIRLARALGVAPDDLDPVSPPPRARRQPRRRSQAA